MKVNDILEKVDLDNPVELKGMWNQNFQRKRTPRGRSNQAGETGAEGSAYHDGPGTVTKIAKIKSLESPYLTFLRDVVLKHQDNLFFPKIYHAKLYKTPQQMDHDYGLILQMEKLASFESDKLKETMPHLFDQLGIRDRHQLVQHIEGENRGGSKRFKGLWQNDPIQALANSIHLALESPTIARILMKETTNPQFSEALKATVPYTHSKKFGGDLHGGNLMVRLTGHGPQLVIIDPFSPFLPAAPIWED